MKKYKNVIGIDPGTKTGFCVVEDGIIKSLSTLKIHTAMQRILELPKDETWIVIEDARTRKLFSKDSMAIFARLQKGGKIGLDEYKRLTTATQGAGSVKRDCTIWEDFLKENGYEFQMPSVGKNKTKVTKEWFNKIAKWSGQSSEHSRDAAMLVSWAWAK